MASVLAVLVLAGCGSQVGTGDGVEDRPADATASSSSSSPSATGSGKAARPSTSPSVPADAPRCASVWREGGRIPRIYQGCVSGETYVERDASPCSSGQRLVRHRNYWGVPGGTVHVGTKPLKDDPEFRRAARECVA